jgi:hypothetical protein
MASSAPRLVLERLLQEGLEGDEELARTLAESVDEGALPAGLLQHRIEALEQDVLTVTVAQQGHGPRSQRVGDLGVRAVVDPVERQAGTIGPEHLPRPQRHEHAIADDPGPVDVPRIGRQSPGVVQLLRRDLRHEIRRAFDEPDRPHQALPHLPIERGDTRLLNGVEVLVEQDRPIVLDANVRHPRHSRRQRRAERVQAPPTGIRRSNRHRRRPRHRERGRPSARTPRRGRRTPDSRPVPSDRSRRGVRRSGATSPWPQRRRGRQPRTPPAQRLRSTRRRRRKSDACPRAH